MYALVDFRISFFFFFWEFSYRSQYASVVNMKKGSFFEGFLNSCVGPELPQILRHAGSKDSFVTVLEQRICFDLFDSGRVFLSRWREGWWRGGNIKKKMKIAT